jgi:hypothetical protein
VTIFNGNYKTLWLSHFKTHKEAEKGLCEKLFTWMKQHHLISDSSVKYDLQAMKILIQQTPSEFEVSAEIVKIGNNKEHEFLL